MPAAEEPATEPDDVRPADPAEPGAAAPEAAEPGAVGPGAADRSAPAEPDGAGSDPAQGPTEEWLLENSVPGRVRRAPRLGSFVVAGLLGGLVVGTIVSLLAVRGSGLAPDQGGGVLPALGGYTGVTLLTAAGLGALGALIGAALGLWADRRSRR